MAIGTTRAIQECGYTIPDDFSVTGYDGLGVLNWMTPQKYRDQGENAEQDEEAVALV